MTETTDQNGSRNALVSDNPAAWAPPEAPLDMPIQELERRSGSFSFLNQLRFLMTGQHV